MTAIARALTRWLQRRESPAPTTPDVSHLDRHHGVGTRPEPLAEWAAVVGATDPGTPIYDQALAAAQARADIDATALIVSAIRRSHEQGDDTAALDYELAGLLDQEGSR